MRVDDIAENTVVNSLIEIDNCWKLSFIRVVDKNDKVYEALLSFHIYGTNTGEDILKELKMLFKKSVFN